LIMVKAGYARRHLIVLCIIVQWIIRHDGSFGLWVNFDKSNL